MPSKKNLDEVKSLENKLSKSSAVFLSDYTNLSVKDQVELRALVRTAGGELKITKNRLLKLALKNQLFSDSQLPSELTEFLRGPNLTLFTSSDPISPLKALVEFAKKNESGKPMVRTGVLDKKVLSITKIQQLAALPSKDQLIGKLIYSIKAPLSNLLSILTAPTRDLTSTLNTLKIKLSTKIN